MSCKLPRSAMLAAALGLCLGAALAAPSSLLAEHRHDKECYGCYGGYGGAYCLPRDVSRPDLFYNFYAQPACAGVPAELYPAPYPTPPLVGHTYYTYQPLMPHEMLYRHKRVYHQYYNYGRGLNRTTVLWW